MNITFPVIKLAQISDMHLLKEATETIHGVNPYERLSRVFDYVASKAYDLVILSGDLADTGAVSSYQQLRHLLKKISLPVLIFLGNHDDSHQFNSTFSEQQNYHLAPNKPILFNGWQLLYVDTVLPGKTHGYISGETAKRLAMQIHQAEDANIALFMHHNPLLTGIAYTDQYGIHNFEAIRNTLTSKVKLIAYGHIHHDLYHWDSRIAYVACPSTAFQINEVGEIDSRCYGLKEYVLEGDQIRVKPIWFVGGE